jgi:hypothetical protein
MRILFFNPLRNFYSFFIQIESACDGDENANEEEEEEVEEAEKRNLFYYY